MSIDPITYVDSGAVGYFNRYAYTMNDPVNAFDPTGMSCVASRVGKAGSGSTANCVNFSPNSGSAPPATQPKSTPSPTAPSTPKPANDNIPKPGNDNARTTSSNSRASRAGAIGGAILGANQAYETGRRIRLKEDFDKDPDAYVALIRWHDGGIGASQYGRSWTVVESVNHPDPRDYLGIPEANGMTMLANGFMRASDFIDPSVTLHRSALAVPSEGLNGGGPEVLIIAPNVRQHIIVSRNLRWTGTR